MKTSNVLKIEKNNFEVTLESLEIALISATDNRAPMLIIEQLEKSISILENEISIINGKIIDAIRVESAEKEKIKRIDDARFEIFKAMELLEKNGKIDNHRRDIVSTAIYILKREFDAEFLTEA